MKKQGFSKEQVDVLRRASRGHPKCYVRKKALAVLNAALGRKYREIAEILDVSLQSICSWVKEYQQRGIEGLVNRRGQGRKRRCDDEDLKRHVLQSPRAFGLQQNRWTVKALIGVVPSLRGFSEPGVQKALKRLKLGYKRGQPRLHSPDPEYEKKSPA